MNFFNDVSKHDLCWFSPKQTRARLSFKRRPPTRQHRRSAGEEALSPCELYSPNGNGDTDQVLDSPAEEAEYGQKEAEEKDRDCENTEDEVLKSDQGRRRDPEGEQEAEQPRSSETLEEKQQPSEPCPAKQIGGDVETEDGQEAMGQQEHKGRNEL